MAKRPKTIKRRQAWLVVGTDCDSSAVACTILQTFTLDGRRMHLVDVSGDRRLVPDGQVCESQADALQVVVMMHDRKLAVLQSARDSYAERLERLTRLDNDRR